MLLTMASGE